ncbi:MAG: DUF6807 family protein, partial [Draconibacterium sp.]|nr:DUF6807 family protein [Draconibacterium sp.]
MKNLTTLFIVLLTALSVNAQLSMQKKDDGILITENGNKVLFFQAEPKSLEGKFERCNYIHPLWASDGTILTEDFPADHYHHRGIFWTWHQVWIGDKRIGDPWEIKDFEQDVVEIEFLNQSESSVQLKTEVEWLSDKWKKNGKKVPYINEKAIITVHEQKGNFRRIDFEISLLALEENLKIGGSEDDKGYSGFSVRMKLPKDVGFEGVDGIVEPIRTAVESPGFINVSGSLLNDERFGGIVMVDHQNNPDYPQKWILRARNSMQNAAWPGR